MINDDFKRPLKVFLLENADITAKTVYLNQILFISQPQNCHQQLPMWVWNSRNF